MIPGSDSGSAGSAHRCRGPIVPKRRDRETLLRRPAAPKLRPAHSESGQRLCGEHPARSKNLDAECPVPLIKLDEDRGAWHLQRNEGASLSLASRNLVDHVDEHGIGDLVVGESHREHVGSFRASGPDEPSATGSGIPYRWHSEALTLPGVWCRYGRRDGGRPRRTHSALVRCASRRRSAGAVAHRVRVGRRLLGRCRCSGCRARGRGPHTGGRQSFAGRSARIGVPVSGAAKQQRALPGSSGPATRPDRVQGARGRLTLRAYPIPPGVGDALRGTSGMGNPVVPGWQMGHASHRVRVERSGPRSAPRPAADRQHGGRTRTL
jgi:hypothetical protein